MFGRFRYMESPRLSHRIADKAGQPRLFRAAQPSEVPVGCPTAFQQYINASWSESVGRFGFRKVSKVVIQDKLKDFEGTMAVTAA